MWLGNFMEISEIKGSNILLTGAKLILADGEYEIHEKEIAKFNVINFTAYIEITHAQEKTVCS